MSGREGCMMRFGSLIGLGLIGCVWVAGAAAQTQATNRLVHRYVSVVISPDGEFVAAVEGNSPPGGYYPPIRDLVIRRVRDGHAVSVAMPCGRVAECWPESPAWSPDGRDVSFSLRTPGSHARTLYAVARDGSNLTKLLEFDGTVKSLRYLPDGRIVMLSTPGALKEAGATEAGVPVSGDYIADAQARSLAWFDKYLK